MNFEIAGPNPVVGEGDIIEVGEDGVSVGATIWFDATVPGRVVIRCVTPTRQPLPGSPLYIVEHGKEAASVRFVHIAAPKQSGREIAKKKTAARGDMDTNSRASQHFGDFGEGLVTYVLIRKGFEVACVDHVGADLIAQKTSHRIAVSVKARRYRRSEKLEARALVIEEKNLEKLQYFADRFALEPVVAHVACFDDDKSIHVFMLRVSDIKEFLTKTDKGYRLGIGKAHLAGAMARPYVGYSSWSNESIDDKLFPD